MAAAISKAIATDLQQDITALVNINNSAACRVFEKLNFRLIQNEHYYWSMIKPNRAHTVSIIGQKLLTNELFVYLIYLCSCNLKKYILQTKYR